MAPPLWCINAMEYGKTIENLINHRNVLGGRNLPWKSITIDVYRVMHSSVGNITFGQDITWQILKNVINSWVYTYYFVRQQSHSCDSGNSSHFALVGSFIRILLKSFASLMLSIQQYPLRVFWAQHTIIKGTRYIKLDIDKDLLLSLCSAFTSRI